MAVNNEDKLEDFGEHIAGAKKELYSRYEFNNHDLSDPQTRKLPLSKLWSKKDIDSIEDTKTAAIAHVLRDGLGNKPRTSVKLERWFRNLEDAQSIVRNLTDNNTVEPERFIADLEDKGVAIGFKMRLLSGLDRDKWTEIKNVSISYPYRNDPEANQLEVDKNALNLNITTKNNRFTLRTETSNKREVINLTLDEINKRLDTHIGKEKDPSTKDFAIYQKIAENIYFIASRYDKHRTPLEQFSTLEEAREYRATNVDSLTKAWLDYKEEHNVKKSDMRKRENEPRAGAYYRDGRDITPEEFMETFNIRGGQFGNWVNDEERTAMLNNAYDGFMDLSVAAKIPPKAIGLNGTLGISFGARGGGWASAHYESTQNVINLTKTRGAGSLAHEWWHAVDHYMGKNDLLTRNIRAKDIKHEELRDLASGLVEAIQKSEYKNRSNKADDYRNIAYFSTNVEMTARAFEAHIINELKGYEIKNDFLSNVVPANEWVKADSSYPYPTQAEVERFKEHYSKIFDKLAVVDANFERTENPAEHLIMLQAADLEKWQNKSKDVIDASNNSQTAEQSNMTSSNTQLYVPYEEINKAKALGAKWDNDNKTWYAPKGSNLDQFSKWREPPKDNSVSPEIEFADYLRSKGVDVRQGHPKLDGKWHRLPHETDKGGKKSASYIVHTDNGIPRGYFKNFKTGEEEKWVSSQRTATSNRPKVDYGAVKAQAEVERKSEYDNSAKIAQAIYNNSIPANPNHGYLVNKQVTANNVVKAVPSNDQLPPDLQDKIVIGRDWREAKALRNNPNEHRVVLTQGDLVVPVQNKNGDVRSIQTIAENGFKGYLKGGEKSGNYTIIGNIENGKPFIIAEGYSTAATIYEQTGQPVVVAFDKNNLSNVGQTLRNQNPDSRIYFAADNDHETAAKLIAQGRTSGELNGGIEQAQAAAKTIDGYVLIPSFEPHEKGSDWNDIFVLKGIDEFKRQMREQVLKARELDNDTKLNITLKKFTDPDLAKVQDNVVKLAVENTNFLLEKYSKMPDTFGGRYIASDKMKEVFTEFSQSSENRNKYNNVVHNAAAALAAEQFNRMVKQPPTDNKNVVVMLTGSPGAGKTSSVMNAGKLKDNVAVVYEGQLANTNHPATLDKFEKALNAGYEVNIVVVNPKPEQALENTFKRFYDPDDGRGSPISTMARIQGNSYDGLKAIHEKFGDKLNLTIIDKPQGNSKHTKYQGWDNLSVLKSQGNEQQIHQRLENHLVSQYKEGRINHECFKQAAGSEERAKQLVQRLDRQLGGTPSQNESRRSLSQSDSRQSDQHRQYHSTTSSSREVGIREQISQRRDTLLNHPKLNDEQKKALAHFTSVADVSLRDMPIAQLNTYDHLLSKVDDIASGKVYIPPPPDSDNDKGLHR